jgi:regulator of sirC expression with transglutaminase-like and TPR domain
VSRFAELARDEKAPLEDIALEIAAEFAPVAAGAARLDLDRLADGTQYIAELDPTERARLFVEVLARGEGFACDGDRDPGSLMLDRVLERRAGHPLALAVVYAAVARRAGFELHPIGNQSVCMLGDPQADPPLAIDPVPRGRPLPKPARWLCPHLLALMLINAIGARYMGRGDIGPAIRAAELRLLLPLGRDARARHEQELASLRALLN